VALKAKREERKQRLEAMKRACRSCIDGFTVEGL
jgi:hypothetical protein